MLFNGIGGGAFLVALLAYVMATRVARRSSHYGGGTVVLSWLGFCVPCIAWIALIQGYFALDRANTEQKAADTRSNLNNFYVWVVVYVLAVSLPGAMGNIAQKQQTLDANGTHSAPAH